MNACSITGLIERHGKRQANFEQTREFRRHKEFNFVRGIRQMNIPIQLDTDFAANWKPIVGDNLNIPAFAVQADFDHHAPDFPSRCFRIPNKPHRNAMSRNLGAGAVRLQPLLV
jgi:hypothetical protein